METNRKSTKDLTVETELSPEEQLARLRGLSKRTGGAHEAQVLQLRLWPFAVDPGLTRAEARVDFGMPCEHQAEVGAALKGQACSVCGHVIGTRGVWYEWQDLDRTPSWKPDAKYKARLRELDRCVKFLLGEGFELSIKLNGTDLFPFVSESSGGDVRKRRNKRPAAKRAKHSGKRKVR